MQSQTKRSCAKFGAVLAGAAVAAFAAAPMSSEAVIHEIVAAYCSGGGHGKIDEHGELLPPGMLRVGTQSFARAPVASGAVDLATLTVTDKPNAKFPAGTSVFAAHVENADHPSAAHCQGAANLP